MSGRISYLGKGFETQYFDNLLLFYPVWVILKKNISNLIGNQRYKNGKNE